MANLLTRFFSSPRISVLIPAYNRPEELRLCLEGFARQTASRKDFEVVVVDDGSTEDLASVASPFQQSLNLRFVRRTNGGPSAARNQGLKLCRAANILLYDDDLRPYPDLVEYCLDFHGRHRAEGDMALLNFQPDASIVDSPFIRWAFNRLYLFPRKEDVFDWKHFWSGTITCKKSVFRHGLFDPAYRMLEDAELGLRLSRHLDLRVHFQPRMTGTYTRRITLSQFYRRQYTIAYFSHFFASNYRGALDFAYPPYNEPEKYMVGDPRQLGSLVSSARTLERSCPTKGDPPKLLQSLWLKAEIHVRANGWITAREGRPAEAPGTIGALLEAS